jgi:hypothetical protein
MKYPRYVVSLVFVAFLGLGFGASSCAKAQPQLSPAGQAAVTGTQVIKALDVVRDFVVDGNRQSPPLFTHAETLSVVNTHESIVKAIAAVPNGYQALANATLDTLQASLPSATWARIAPYITLVRSLIAGI